MFECLFPACDQAGQPLFERCTPYFSGPRVPVELYTLIAPAQEGQAHHIDVEVQGVRVLEIGSRGQSTWGSTFQVL